MQNPFSPAFLVKTAVNLEQLRLATEAMRAKGIKYFRHRELPAGVSPVDARFVIPDNMSTVTPVVLNKGRGNSLRKFHSFIDERAALLQHAASAPLPVKPAHEGFYKKTFQQRAAPDVRIRDNYKKMLKGVHDRWGAPELRPQHAELIAGVKRDYAEHVRNNRSRAEALVHDMRRGDRQAFEIRAQNGVAARETLDQLTRPRPNRIVFPQNRAAQNEMFNRTMLLHEGTELVALRNAMVRRARQQSSSPLSKFVDHVGVLPPLGDLNIAATLRGPGATETADALRRMRSYEVQRIYKAHPSLQRLDLGNTRLSRHALRRLEAMYPA